MENRSVTVRPDNCCGCGACRAVCPVGAVSMTEDEYGFVMPKTDLARCIGCGRCVSVCSFLTPEKYLSGSLPIKAYAAVNRDEKLLKRSSSGGVFAGAARAVLNSGGAVYGAAMGKDFSVKHIGIDSENSLRRIQGSKYTQSDTSEVFSSVKEKLASGRRVLFSGTPCQAAALKAYLGDGHEGLYIIDLVCHGVSSNRLFKEDIACLSRRYGSPVRAVFFRSKRRPRGAWGELVLESGIKEYSPLTSPYYYYYYAAGSILRDSCCHCPYAQRKRVGDMTVGDFWRIETLFRGGGMNTGKGVSCLMVNTPKGMELLDMFREQFMLREVGYEEIVKRNGNLRGHCKADKKRDKLLELYRRKGYGAVASYYRTNERKNVAILKLRGIIPTRLKTALKRKLLK